METYFQPTLDAAKMADKELNSSHPDLKGRQLNFSVGDCSLRKEWMDSYIKFGGKAEAVGKSGIRIAPMIVKNDLVKKVDDEFSKNYGLKRKLSFSIKDCTNRKNWMDMYVKMGGKYAYIGKSGIRVAIKSD